ncbi:PLP-dependent cysteine synthase family protein [Curtobacterium sp. USHLN213]|uniref:PLP-dependent cysteine synthase family protein n=1 Tax=Curtobacterium sp. USHLN213 TaxID=3081255 RepID=UPI00301B153A
MTTNLALFPQCVLRSVMSMVLNMTSTWAADAISFLIDDARSAAPTPIRRLHLPAAWGVTVVLKDESVHQTGSLKHRLARSLFLHAVVDGLVGPDTTIVEASSGSTAVSEAAFSRQLGLPFIAVVPSSTSSAKVALIESFGGAVERVDDASQLVERSREIARERDGYFMDQFGNASRVTDWAGESGIAAELFSALRASEHGVPSWVVVGAGTGGTSATLGRYRRSRNLATRIAVADPEGSAYFDAVSGTPSTNHASRIEGIGRPVVEPSFLRGVVDEAFRIDDMQSVAAMRFLSEEHGIHAGPSTGTNLVAALTLAAEMRARGERGLIASLICDTGDRYLDTYYDDAWIATQGYALAERRAALGELFDTGCWPDGFAPLRAVGVLR